MRIARLFTVVLAAVLLAAAGAAQAAPETGWWWNAAESGRGYFVESHDGIIYIAGYFYDTDGRALWLVSGGTNADPYHYSGRLLRYSGGQTLFGDYRPPATPTDAGAVSVDFTDDQHGTITWPGGVIAIEREIFGTGTPPFQPLSGWWWDPDESGRGYSVEVQGNNLFMVAFMYDDAGNPVWYFTAGPMASATHYDGQWVQFANGQRLGGAYRPPDPPTAVGYVSIEFDAADEATFIFSDSASGARVKRGRTISVQREFTSPPPYVFPARLDGSFHYSSHTSAIVTGGSLFLDVTADGAMAFVQPSGDALPPLQPGIRGPVQLYEGIAPTGPGLQVTISYHTIDEGGNCAGSTTATVSGAASSSNLTMNRYGKYAGLIEFTPLPFTIHVTCATSPPFSFDLQQVAAISMPIKGAVVYGLHGKWAGGTPPSFTASGSWDFAVANP